MAIAVTIVGLAMSRRPHWRCISGYWLSNDGSSGGNLAVSGCFTDGSSGGNLAVSGGVVGVKERLGGEDIVDASRREMKIRENKGKKELE